MAVRVLMMRVMADIPSDRQLPDNSGIPDSKGFFSSCGNRVFVKNTSHSTVFLDALPEIKSVGNKGIIIAPVGRENVHLTKSIRYRISLSYPLDAIMSCPGQHPEILVWSLVNSVSDHIQITGLKGRASRS